MSGKQKKENTCQKAEKYKKTNKMAVKKLRKTNACKIKRKVPVEMLKISLHLRSHL